MGRSQIILFLFIAATAGLLSACQKKVEDAATAAQQYLYFASGACFVGNYTGSKVATTTSSGMIGRITLDSSQIQGIPVIDYNIIGVNFWPGAISNYDNDYLLATVSTSTTGLRIDKIKKSSLQEKQDYVADTTNLNGVLRSMSITADGSILISKSSGVEKYNAARNRVQNTNLSAAFAAIPTSGSACSSTTSTLSNVTSLPNGMVFFSNGAAGFVKVGVLSATGYASAADCKSAVSFSGSPAATAQVTAAVLVPGTDPYQMIVSTANTTVGNDQIWLFSIDSSTGAVSFVKSLYSDTSYIRGISAMTYDPATSSLYVSNGSTSTANTIEKLTYNSTAQSLVRTSTFMSTNNDTQCINSMFIAN